MIMQMNMVGALNNALELILKENDKVVLLGEDIGKDGGVFRVTDGLQAKFGENRVIDTPLAESVIIGASIGMAHQGCRPIRGDTVRGLHAYGFRPADKPRGKIQEQDEIAGSRCR